MRIKNQKDFFGGLLFIAIGLAFAWGASAYEIGRAAHMGPGYFPLAVGVLLAALGAVIVFKSLVIETADGEPVGRWPWRPLFFITLANALFGLLLGGAPWRAWRPWPAPSRARWRRWRWPRCWRWAAGPLSSRG